MRLSRSLTGRVHGPGWQTRCSRFSSGVFSVAKIARRASPSIGCPLQKSVLPLTASLSRQAILSPLENNIKEKLMKAMVVHCKREAFDVYIGRPGKWGNPFVIGKDGTRQQVIAKYRKWLVSQTSLMKALPELKGKVLGCWCAPQACHGDVLAELANA
jgi:hypothetical protein